MFEYLQENHGIFSSQKIVVNSRFTGIDRTFRALRSTHFHSPNDEDKRKYHTQTLEAIAECVLFFRFRLMGFFPVFSWVNHTACLTTTKYVLYIPYAIAQTLAHATLTHTQTQRETHRYTNGETEAWKRNNRNENPLLKQPTITTITKAEVAHDMNSWHIRIIFDIIILFAPFFADIFTTILCNTRCRILYL